MFGEFQNFVKLRGTQENKTFGQLDYSRFISHGREKSRLKCEKLGKAELINVKRFTKWNGIVIIIVYQFRRKCKSKKFTK